MPAPWIEHAIFHYILEFYGTIKDLHNALYAPLGVSMHHFSMEEAATELINDCKYHGRMGQLIHLILNVDDPGKGFRGKVKAKREQLHKRFEGMLLTINERAVSIAPDLLALSSIQNLLDPEKAKFLHKIRFQGDMDQYYIDLAKLLDCCGAHLVLLGDPSESQTKHDDGDPLPFPIERYCSFFQDLPTYVLLPKGSLQQWQHRVCILTSSHLNWPLRKIEEYEDELDMTNKLSDLIEKLSDSSELWYSYPLHSLLEKKRATNSFDVFLCHNSLDKESVKRIGKQLEEREILPWLDERDICPGAEWITALEEQIEYIKSAAVFIGPSGIGRWQAQEIQVLLRQFVNHRFPVIPVILEGTEEVPNLPNLSSFLGNLKWVDFRKSETAPLEQLIWGISGKQN